MRAGTVVARAASGYVPAQRDSGPLVCSSTALVCPCARLGLDRRRQRSGRSCRTLGALQHWGRTDHEDWRSRRAGRDAPSPVGARWRQGREEGRSRWRYGRVGVRAGLEEDQRWSRKSGSAFARQKRQRRAGEEERDGVGGMRARA